MKSLIYSLLGFILVINPIKTQSIQQQLKDLMGQANVPGISLSVLNDGVVTESYHFGYKSADSKTPVSENTIFSAAS